MHKRTRRRRCRSKRRRCRVGDDGGGGMRKLRFSRWKKGKRVEI